jgi:hypothetical protein
MAVTVSPHTAISSCSGYIYQGKIALMHCLKLFENLGTQAREFSLEIESLDDFAIKNADGSYRSMHQVKAKKRSKVCSLPCCCCETANRFFKSPQEVESIFMLQ